MKKLSRGKVSSEHSRPYARGGKVRRKVKAYADGGFVQGVVDGYKAGMRFRDSDDDYGDEYGDEADTSSPKKKDLDGVY